MPDFLESAEQSSTENKTFFLKKLLSLGSQFQQSLLASFSQGISLYLECIY